MELKSVLQVHSEQRHWDQHSATCRRHIKVRGGIITICRFEFPRPRQPLTTINHDSSTFSGVPGARTKLYSLARLNHDEQMTNDYSAALLRAWNGNIDVQYVGADTDDIVNYITAYTTKHESTKSERALRSEMNMLVTQKEAFKVFNCMLKNREIGRYYWDRPT